MRALEEITDILSERGSKLNRADLQRIDELSVDVPLEDSDALSIVAEGIALIVNDPEYKGDIAPID